MKIEIEIDQLKNFAGRLASRVIAEEFRERLRIAMGKAAKEEIERMLERLVVKGTTDNKFGVETIVFHIPDDPTPGSILPPGHIPEPNNFIG